MLEVESVRVVPSFPVVGIGASAGGLEAFSQLLECLPADTGMAFVLIQHLDRTHPSLLREALAKTSTMPVRQAEQGMQVAPGHVYVIGPNTCISMHHGLLQLSPRGTEPSQHLPVDFFLQSLAKELGSRAIGVVLSGSASDGTEGLRAIRAEDGIALAQDPRSAKFPGMPQSAIDAGVVDYCLKIPELAKELVRLSHHPYEQQLPAEALHEGQREAIFARIQVAVGVDFREYKPPTIARRLARRLAVRGVDNLEAYLTLLEREPDEAAALCEDLLIHVTSFFRDPEVFDALRSQVFPAILKHKTDGSAVRIWVAGCSTGEEVYSLAIALSEFLGDSGASHPIQIFGSDVSEAAIQRARAGVYSDAVMRDVSEERRKRYFNKVDGGQRISKSVRDQCVFVRHDLGRDPPFSKLDLASCRNLLIYFDQALHARVLQTLHYCLNQPGFLLLGRSENISGASSLFGVVDKANKIFMRSAAASSLRFAPRADVDLQTGRLPERSRPFSTRGEALSKHVDRLLLARYSPPGVLVNQNLDVLLFRGQTGAYLQAAPGQPQSNLIGMAREGLISALRATVEQARRDAVVVRSPKVEFDQDGATKTCDVVVIPFSGLPDQGDPLFVVMFEQPRQAATEGSEVRRLPEGVPSASPEHRRIERLEHELSSTKEYLHTLIEEHGRASDELGTSNEELISGNEELQSMNEELETAKEEMQSINEELTTLNDELRVRNQEMTQVNADLLNFALTVDTPIVTLDMELRVRRLTPKASSVLNVWPSDIGHSIDDIRLHIGIPDLRHQMESVMASSAVRESEVQDRDGRWYRMQIRPYTLTDRTTDGVILSLIDIDGLKHLVVAAEEARAQAEDARAEAEQANTAKDDFLATLSHELRTPLSSMLLNAQRLRSGDVIERADLQRAGEALERATWMQVKLIDDLLDVSRIIAGKLTLESQSVDLSSVIRASLDSVVPLVNVKQLNLKLALDPTLGPIWADRVRVQQVVSNLLTNAIKFTPRGGQVSVTVEAEPGFARLRVVDSGIGIEAAFLPHVFARFSQRDTSITRKYGGLGLGLALVRHLVELQGGTVSAESEGPGRGATFSVTFPFAPVAADPSDLPSDARQVHALDRPGRTKHYDGLVGLRVLFIDDDLRTREAVQEVLQLTGAVIALAGSAAEAVEAVDTFKPQVILCDIAMPGEDGYTFMRKLRVREAALGTAIPALALTALATAEDRGRAIRAGFQLHLAKPIDIDRLRDAVLELSSMVKRREA